VATPGGTTTLEPQNPTSPHRPATTYGTHYETATAAFALPTSRLVPCLLKATGSVGLGALSAFLIAEIPHAPGLMTNIIVLSAVGIVGAVALAALALRDAVCRLVVDDRGVRILPFPFGETIEWGQITSWRMSDEPEEYTASRQLMLWTRDTNFPKLLPIGRLAREARRSLHKVMNDRLGGEA
jgi:hypothetical protein